MTNFPIIQEDEVRDPQAVEVYASIKEELGFGMVPNLFKSMAIDPPFLEVSWHKFRNVVLRGKLPRTLKEMVGVAISQANGSEYALRVHLHGLSALGISEEVLHLLVNDFENCPLPQRQKSVIRFGLKSATDYHSLTKADYQELYDLGLDECEVFEIVATANLFTGVNQYTDSVNLEIDQL